MARWYGLDYRDRWRYDADGVRRLTLRMILVRVRYLPPEAAIARIEDPGVTWRLEHHLLDDLRMIVEAGITHKRPKVHPARMRAATPTRTVIDPARQRKLVDARRRARARRQHHEEG